MGELIFRTYSNESHLFWVAYRHLEFGGREHNIRLILNDGTESIHTNRGRTSIVFVAKKLGIWRRAK